MWSSGLTSAMTLTLIFQCQICNLLYLSPKWSDCHKTKSKHIDWTLGLKCDHQVWPRPWPWSLNFQGQLTLNKVGGWIYQSICQQSLLLYNTHPTWLFLTNEWKFVDQHNQINLLSLIKLLLLINKFSFVCEGQSCRVRITITAAIIWPFQSHEHDEVTLKITGRWGVSQNAGVLVVLVEYTVWIFYIPRIWVNLSIPNHNKTSISIIDVFNSWGFLCMQLLLFAVKHWKDVYLICEIWSYAFSSVPQGHIRWVRYGMFCV